MVDFILQSPAFSTGGEIPKKYGYKIDNTSPPLKIIGIPSETKSLVLIMDDPDAQAAVGKIWVHWIIWNIDPATTDIAEDSLPPEALEGKSDFDEIGYGGPAPPDKIHTYVFKLYALDKKLDLAKGSNKKQVEQSMQDHIISNTSLTGTFTP